MDLRKPRKSVVILLALLAPLSLAEKVRPDLKCGPSIPRNKVKVVDLRDFESKEAFAEHMEQEFGEVRVVGTDYFRAMDPRGGALKHAKEFAAKNGCDILVITQRWSEEGGTFPIPNGVTGTTRYRMVAIDHARVVYATTTPEPKPEKEPETSE